MLLNIVSEINKPKKIFTYLLKETNTTVIDFLKLLNESNLIDTANAPAIDVWVNDNKILIETKTIESYKIKPKDKVFIREGVEVEYDESSKEVIQLIKFGYSAEEILAALAITNNDLKQAYTLLFDEYKEKLAEEQEEAEEALEDDYRDVQPYIAQTLDTLAEVDTAFYNELGDDEEKLRLFCEEFKKRFASKFGNQAQISKESSTAFINAFLLEVCDTKKK